MPRYRSVERTVEYAGLSMTMDQAAALFELAKGIDGLAHSDRCFWKHPAEGFNIWLTVEEVDAFIAALGEMG